LRQGAPDEVPGQTKARPSGGTRSVSKAEATELPVLQPALEAVARNDFAAALAAISMHQRRFPSGQLAEEREALRVRALVGLGLMAEARSAEAAFRERFPHSAVRRQVAEMLERQ
jgi:hypothetical protein